METAPLKTFAAWARNALIREVTGRIAVVLAPSSPERVEQPSAVAALEKAIAAAGGSNEGRDVVADKVAYTWFNRIVALRFMDANGYTGIGVVSPERRRDVGQPEILAEAKRGNIDSTVVTSKRTEELVTSLLNGTRRSDDPQGEAYTVLLAEYCRHWNRSMPFMFEREGGYTELLIPANLLADESVMARAVAVLTEEVCRDVEVIGWLYQFYISERKDAVFAGLKTNKKAGAAEIPAATQLFTPHWIVRYLVENSLGRLWLSNRPFSRLVDQMEYYVAPADEETNYLKVTSPEELKIIDPACGSGHMLTYAFDLLYAIYEEEGYAPSDIPGLILVHNLYGTEIDPRAGALAAFALTMKARARQRTFFNRLVEPNICVLEPISFTPTEINILATRSGDLHDEEAFWNQFENADTRGSLIIPREELIRPLRRHLDVGVVDDGDLLGQDLNRRARRIITQAEYLSQRYNVVVANPPYMGSKSVDSALADFAKREYPDSKSDLFAMFIERCLGFTLDAGFVGMITMQSWMFLSSYENLRLRILKSSPPVVMAHLGDRAFDSIGGSVVSTTAFVLSRRSAADRRAVYFRLVDGGTEGAKQRLALQCIADAEGPLVSKVAAESFAALPGSPIAYWLSARILELVEKSAPISDALVPRQGLFTTDNARFLRYFWEVSWNRTCVEAASDADALASHARWFAHNKGGANRKWFGNYEHLVDWEDLGRRIKQTAAAKYPYLKGNVGLVVHDDGYYFRPAISWSEIGDTAPAFRMYDSGFTFNIKGMSAFPADGSTDIPLSVLALLNSPLVRELAPALNPTMSFGVNNFRSLPFVKIDSPTLSAGVATLVEIAREDWDSFETSWNFRGNPLLASGASSLRDAYQRVADSWLRSVATSREVEEQLNQEILRTLGLDDELSGSVAPEDVTLLRNPRYRYSSGLSDEEVATEARREALVELVSYAIGCMFGRYSLDAHGLILANQGDTLQHYLAKVPDPSFAPDADNVIPLVDGEWFEDDIVAKFRKFLRAAFGEHHFEENLRFVTESLRVQDLRDYFVRYFYKDHVQRYKKRPIYWLFSSPRGSFNALIYMHRYTPSTVSTVLNEYLREFKAKLEASRQHHERLAASADTPRAQAAARKEVDRLRKVLLELDEYEHGVLYPLATQQVEIDLDDGVKVNYPKLGSALRKIPGLEARDE
jgi:hypothetical protein